MFITNALMNKIAKYCWEVGGERKGTEKNVVT